MIEKHCKPFNLAWLDSGIDYLITCIDNYDFTHDFSLTQKEIPELKDVLRLMIVRGMYVRSLDVVNKLKISRRTAQKYLLRLCKLRWCMRGRWVTYNDINPFLQFLIYLSPKKMGQLIHFFAPRQVDLLNLLSYSLLEAIDEKVNDVKFIWSQKEPDFGNDYFPSLQHIGKFYPYFNGTVQIKAETESRDYYSTLPYNIHWTGRNSHITLPIPFKFYGVQDVGYSSKINKLKVHFDNSITVGIPLGSASYSSRKLLNEWGLKHWSDMANSFMNKYWKNEYVETFNFQTHEEIIKNRLLYKAIPIKQVSQKTFLLKQCLAEI